MDPLKMSRSGKPGESTWPSFLMEEVAMSKPRLLVPFLAISASFLVGRELIASSFPSQAVPQSSKSEQAQSEGPKPRYYFVSTGDPNLKLQHRVSPSTRQERGWGDSKETSFLI
jgi:hypothetical protein